MRAAGGRTLGPTMRVTLLIVALNGFLGVKVFSGMSPSSSSSGTLVRSILATSAARAATPRRPWRIATRRESDLEGVKVCIAHRARVTMERW